MRDLITGAPGAGTTTLGRALATELGAAFVDADDHFWEPTEPPYQAQRTSPERLASILSVLEAAPVSVVAGSVVGWGEALEDSFSLVVYLWVPADVRAERLVARETQRFGKPLDGFIEWAAQYDEGRLPGRSRAIHERWLAQRRCPVLRIEGVVGVGEALARVVQALSRGPAFRGEGPGAITRDGCAVELYRRLPYRGEVELIAPYIEGTEVLELGCGTGRLTRRLLARGYRVTAVDNSPEMLAHVPVAARTVCADIEGLALGTAFDAVVLASCLVNTPCETHRVALLRACFDHLRPDGRLLFERYDPAWLARATAGPLGKVGDVEMHLDRVARDESAMELSLRCRAGSDEWVQHFSAAPLDDDRARKCLAKAGFSPPSWIDARWGVATRG